MNKAAQRLAESQARLAALEQRAAEKPAPAVVADKAIREQMRAEGLRVRGVRQTARQRREALAIEIEKLVASEYDVLTSDQLTAIRAASSIEEAALTLVKMRAEARAYRLGSEYREAVEFERVSNSTSGQEAWNGGCLGDGTQMRKNERGMLINVTGKASDESNERWTTTDRALPRLRQQRGDAAKREKGKELVAAQPPEKDKPLLTPWERKEPTGEELVAAYWAAVEELAALYNKKASSGYTEADMRVNVAAAALRRLIAIPTPAEAQAAPAEPVVIAPTIPEGQAPQTFAPTTDPKATVERTDRGTRRQHHRGAGHQKYGERGMPYRSVRYDEWMSKDATKE